MRQTVNLNKGWRFAKGFCGYPLKMPTEFEVLDLPHTWNGVDGQDGGNDYFRGTCVYCKRLNKSELPKNDRYFLEICCLSAMSLSGTFPLSPFCARSIIMRKAYRPFVEINFVPSQL